MIVRFFKRNKTGKETEVKALNLDVIPNKDVAVKVDKHYYSIRAIKFNPDKIEYSIYLF